MNGDNQIGKITKEFSDILTEMFTNADRFSIICKFKNIYIEFIQSMFASFV